MKVASFILFSLLGSALAAPVIVWKKDTSSSVVHTSKIVTAASLISSAVNVPADEGSLASVVFLLGRADDGTEKLSALASSGALPNVASKYDAAHAIHHHVSGMESPHAIASLARKGFAENSQHRVLEISLSELNRKLTSLKENAKPIEHVEVGQDGILSKANSGANHRARALAQADVIIVNVGSNTDASEIDRAVVNAIEHDSVKNVILAGIRSVDEVKHARALESRRRMSIHQTESSQLIAGRRRLEDADAGNDDANANQDMSGTYYVLMTPNIFAGILFTFLFSFVAWTGINCMGMIQGQDVFVNKMPSVGREA
jgi:hypothetical protein